MKKIYINPSTSVIAVKTQKHMLFGSPNGDNTLNGGGKKGDFDVSMEQASRQGFDLWDDEEE